ncbi:head maturation protease, ClpP-related [Lactiplantibacillus plantarum]|uniref:head maturation protease, ClpP-related n=1 Tax=Lactiplantibacillus plantarum TaxID=1590 RepID=UPI004035F48C
MPKKVMIKGNVVDDETGTFYDWFNMPSAHPSAVASVLNDGRADDEVIVDIASNGGDVFAASEIYTMLRNYAGRVTVNIQGLAASAASLIAMAGDKVNISPTGQIMIHKASANPLGNADDLSHEVMVLNGIDQSIAAAYEAKTGMNATNVLQLMAQETWLTPQDAVDKGFADEIMFVDANKPVFTNSVADIPSKNALNKFFNLVAQVQQVQNKPEKGQPVSTLMSSKLAILMGTNKEAN